MVCTSLSGVFSFAKAGISKTRMTADRIADFAVFTLPSTGIEPKGSDSQQGILSSNQDEVSIKQK
jgi:hypothetical protein